ncbi:hypothetical protein [Rhodopseudomonas pseudopalustris]|uniref:META domain-containing protein n=1 Tax=Rhodopseudomonas pseudopalustris TaxID=1513892 RepID=A0A1H8WVE5_9BRAD|nr:hypothetical protein [Rhodopseudomonas pseudopalustris]SEP31654.1 hypothetical protein SAMN05444123_11449 [Rhodopseudomonas pseudopalustris]
MRTLIVAAIGCVALASPAAAQLSAPAAIVEEVKGDVPGIEFMDYVLPGKVIKLGANGAIVLNYLQSCIRETITGGVVVVGTDQSKVSLADIQTAKVDCAASKAQLSESEASQSAATAFRSINQTGPAPKIASVYGVSPVFDVAGSGKLIIERSDVAGDRREVTVDKKTLIKGRFYDMAKAGTALMPGASYAATFGARKIAFRVDPAARPGDVPVVSRLLRF